MENRERRVGLQLRLPGDLHERLVRLAEREHRSLNAQIVHTLTRAVEQADREQKKGA